MADSRDSHSPNHENGVGNSTFNNNNDANPNFIHQAAATSSSSRCACMSDHAVQEMLKIPRPSFWTEKNLKKYNNDFLFKTINGPSVFKKCFEKVVLKPSGGVRREIRIINHNNNNQQQQHHLDDPDNNNNQKATDDVVVKDGDDGRIHSLPYKKNGPYTCSKCMTVFETSQKFAAHTSSHYKHESKVERMKRQTAKMIRRGKKRTLLELQQQQIKDFGGGEGGSALQTNVEDQVHNNNNINNYDAPPGFDVRFAVGKIKMEPLS